MDTEKSSTINDKEAQSKEQKYVVNGISTPKKYTTFSIKNKFKTSGTRENGKNGLVNGEVHEFYKTNNFKVGTRINASNASSSQSVDENNNSSDSFDETVENNNISHESKAEKDKQQLSDPAIECCKYQKVQEKHSSEENIQMKLLQCQSAYHVSKKTESDDNILCRRSLVKDTFLVESKEFKSLTHLSKRRLSAHKLQLSRISSSVNNSHNNIGSVTNSNRRRRRSYKKDKLSPSKSLNDLRYENPGEYEDHSNINEITSGVKTGRHRSYSDSGPLSPGKWLNDLENSGDNDCFEDSDRTKEVNPTTNAKVYRRRRSHSKRQPLAPSKSLNDLKCENSGDEKHRNEDGAVEENCNHNRRRRRTYNKNQKLSLSKSLSNLEDENSRDNCWSMQNDLKHKDYKRLTKSSHELRSLKSSNYNLFKINDNNKDRFQMKGSFFSRENHSIERKTRSPSPNFGRDKSGFDMSINSRRSHSTGHSPDMTKLLQHLICDIEEEIPYCSSDDDINKSLDKEQFQTFTNNLNELISQSNEYINELDKNDIINKSPIEKSEDYENEKPRGRRKIIDEDDESLKRLRLQREQRKRFVSIFYLREKPEQTSS